jgi:hypothetical protein
MIFSISSAVIFLEGSKISVNDQTWTLGYWLPDLTARGLYPNMVLSISLTLKRVYFTITSHFPVSYTLCPFNIVQASTTICLFSIHLRFNYRHVNSLTFLPHIVFPPQLSGDVSYVLLPKEFLIPECLWSERKLWILVKP